ELGIALIPEDRHASAWQARCSFRVPLDRVRPTLRAFPLTRPVLAHLAVAFAGHYLRPLLLDDLGLVAAIDWLANSFSQRTGVLCEVRADEELELEEPYATAVFRILQESLANVGKHAKASRVEVKLERSSDAVYLQVQDNGIGFDLKSPRKPNSLGLMGLHERAHLLKGSLTMSSEPGQGTRIEVRIPVQGGPK
ncbi:MAG: ATP-binding protein, partial [Pseudomonadota bacterium]